MARFVSEFSGLLLQDDAGVWAHFQQGAFATDDPKVAERLRSIAEVTEDKADAEPVAPRKSK